MGVVVSSSSLDDETERVGDRYVVLRPVRKGGMGALSLALDTVAGELVLLKRLPPGSGEALRARFLDEIRVTATLDHPNLVKARASGQVDGREFLVCDWIAGPDIERLLEVAGRYDMMPPVAVVVGVFVQILDGLAYLHRAGFIHRDASPANMMVGYDGTAHLVDYGIATFDGKQSRTVLDVVPGTQGYIAPELEAGKPATERSDLYSVASSLWFALTGLKFFDHGVDNDGKVQLSRRLAERGRGDVPSGLLTFLWRNLHRSPSVRCESADEAKAMLTASIPPASTTEIARFVGQIFAAEKQLAAEQLKEWKRKYAAPAPKSTAVLPRVAAEQPARSDTLVVDRGAAVGSSGRRRVAVAVGIAAVVIAVAALGAWVWRRRTTVDRAEIVPPVVAPGAPVVTSLTDPETPDPSPPPPSVPLALPPSTTTTTPSPSSSRPANRRRPEDNLDSRRRLSEANDLLTRGRTSSAREVFTELTADPVMRPHAFLGLARLAYKTGDYAEAIAMATKASAAGAGPDALMVRASAHLRLGRADKAEADFERVLAVQPDNKDAADGKMAAAQLRREAPP
jgi:serine/threonine-protein kinase